MRWRDVKQHKIKTPPKKTPPSAPALPYASVPDRIKAFITDSFLLAMPLFYIIIYLVFDGLRGEGGVEGHRMETWLFILIPLGFITTFFWSKTGQTPGMKAYQIKLIDNQTKEKPSFVMGILRFFFFNVAFFSIIGIMISFFRKDSRGLQDLLSGTSLIKVADA